MIDARLSRDIEIGAIARPRYSTDIVRTEGGFTFAVPRWRYPLFTFEFSLEPGDPEDEGHDFSEQTLREFIELWHCAGGRDQSFLFRHWGDYRGTDQLIAYGDGSTTEFQLYRVYTSGLVTRQRKITRPVAGTVTAKVDGVPAALASVDTTTGLITFSAAPGAATDVTATFEFDLPVRFGDDTLELVALTQGLDRPTNIVLEEQRERSS